MSRKKLIKIQTEKNIEKIFWNLREINIDLGVKFNNFSLSSNREMWNMKSAIMKLQQGQIVLHKQIKQLNKIVKKTLIHGHAVA